MTRDPPSSMIQLAPGAYVQLDDAPTIRITVPDREAGVRITVIVLPIAGGAQVPDTGMAADLPRRASAFDVEVPPIEGVERQTVYVLATRRGKNIEVPLFHLDVTDSVSCRGGAEGHRVAIAGELYRYNDKLRFKVSGQGHSMDWDAFRGQIQCPYDLKGILADTRTEYDPPIPQVDRRTPSPQKRRSSRSPSIPETSPAGSLPPTLCRLVYHAEKHGTSTRDVYVVSIRQDRILARSSDAQIPKTFLISGIRELYDIDTGEDLMPRIHEVARHAMTQMTA